jgi:ribonuclease J
MLMRLTSSITGKTIPQSVSSYRSFVPFTIGPFQITPFLTDHSAFDAHMLLVEVGGKRILYSGDFRRTGRKAKLVDHMMAAPPSEVDVLLMEGTTLGRSGHFPSESDLEAAFIDLFRSTPGRVFVTWSAQNVDRTVTLYLASRRAGRTLLLDIYALDVLERLAGFRDTLPRLGLPGIRGVVTGGIKGLYEDPKRMNNAAFFEQCCLSGRAFSASKLESGQHHNVIMLRPSLLRDYLRKGLAITKNDAWVFSMWSGYLKKPEFNAVQRQFDEIGATFARIHTSGHASPNELEAFAAAVAPRHLVPIHSFDWDDHAGRFANVKRLRDGEAFEIGASPSQKEHVSPDERTTR